MPLTLAEFSQFKKLMALTVSSSDYETLSAIRKANTILAKHGATWPQVLDRVLKVELTVESGEEEDIERLFELALASATGEFRTILEDVYERWERTRTLSPKQRAMVAGAAQRAVR